MYPSDFNRIDSTRCTTQIFNGINARGILIWTLIPMKICVVQRVESIRLKSEGYNLLYSYFWAYIWKIDMKSRDHFTTNILFGFRKYRSFWAWKHKPKIFLGTHLNEYLIFLHLLTFFHFFTYFLWSKIVKNYPV